MKKAAVIGLGTVSAVHLSAISENPEIELVGVCDIQPAKRKQAPEGVPFFTDYKEMIQKTKPDVVHLCLPHYLHFPVAREAAEMGVNIFCEKPVALSSAEATCFSDLEKNHPDLHMGICLQNRKNASVQMLKKIIYGNSYGRVTGLRGVVTWFRPREYYEESPWRGKWKTAGGGCLINQAIHTLDLLYYLGGEINKVKAFTSQLLDYGIEVEDTAAARLKYSSGASGLFFATIANYKNEAVQISVQLEQAEFQILENTLYRIYEDGTREKLVQDEKLPGSKFYYGAGHRTIINQFYKALEEESQDYVHICDAWMSIHLIDAIQESGRTGKEVQL
jgi:UDP-N-acetyl-2-amino-2-deoxyglucuronate dehydrogenase